MSARFEQVKHYFDSGLWSAERVYNAVGRWITAEEYQIITGQPYPTNPQEVTP